MSLLDACGLVPEVDEDLSMEDVAGAVDEALGPEVTSFPLVVAGFDDVVDPAEAGLGADDFELWEAFEGAGEEHVGDGLGLEAEAGGGAHGLKLVAGVAVPAVEGELAHAGAGVEMDGDVEVLAGVPDGVPVAVVDVGKAVVILAWFGEHDDTLVAVLTLRLISATVESMPDL